MHLGHSFLMLTADGGEWSASFYFRAVAYRGRGFGVFKPPPKFLSFDKAEPNSQFRGKYIRNNLTRIRLSLIF